MLLEYLRLHGSSRLWLKATNLQSAGTVRTLAAMATDRELTEKETSELLHKYRSDLQFPPDSNLRRQNQDIFRSNNDSKFTMTNRSR